MGRGAVIERRRGQRTCHGQRGEDGILEPYRIVERRKIADAVDAVTGRHIEDETIVAAAAGQHVRTEPAMEIVVAGTAVNGVRTTLAPEMVVSAETEDRLIGAW